MARKLKSLSREKTLKLKPFLDEWVRRIEQPEYVEKDPVLFMHAFSDKEDQALAGFFAAIMAWGRRDIIIRKVQDLLDRMDNRPAEFIGNFAESDAHRFDGFKHRTFKPSDIYWLVKILSTILRRHHSFEEFWRYCYQKARTTGRELIAVFHEEFFALQPETPRRSRKHISNSEKHSSCKRLYLYLRWAVRKNSPVDLGIMDFMPPSELILPLDVHVARQARALGLLTRHYNDWKAALEITRQARLLDPEDPAKYDYALFGLGVSDYQIPEDYIINDPAG